MESTTGGTGEGSTQNNQGSGGSNRQSNRGSDRNNSTVPAKANVSLESVGCPVDIVSGKNGFAIALIAAELVAANIIRGEAIADYFNKESGVITGSIKDDKLQKSVDLAKRLIELSSR